MRNKWLLLCTAVVVGVALVIPTLNAQVDPDQQVTQGELAKLMVNILDLSREIPGRVSTAQAVGILMKNKVMPAEGWQPGEVVTRAVLARVVVQALGMTDQVENPDDPKSWIDLLTEMNVPIATVGQATSNLGPLSIPVAPGVGSTTVDPLEAPVDLVQEEGLQDGADISSNVRPVILQYVINVLAAVAPTPPARIPVTPN